MPKERQPSSPFPAGVDQANGRSRTRSGSTRAKGRKISTDNTWNRNSPIILSRLQSDPGLLFQSAGPRLPAQLRSLSTSDIEADEESASQESNTLSESSIRSRPQLASQESGSSSVLAQAVGDLDVTFNDANEEARDEGGDQVMAEIEPAEEQPAVEDEEEPPQSLLDFAMPEATLKDALAAIDKGYKRYWSFTMYRGPDGKRVMCHYCCDKEHSERIAKLFLEKQLLGMDLEWKSFLRNDTDAPLKDRVSLIQLASQDLIGLFHIAKFEGTEAKDLMTPTLKQIIEDENVRKIGVNIGNDGNKLQKYLGVEPKGLFELSHLHRLVKYAKDSPKWVNKRLVSLSDQVEEHLLLPLRKDEVRTSDWTQQLDQTQRAYASSDVYASIHLYDALDMKRRAMKPVPPMPENWDRKMPIRLSNAEAFKKEADADDVEDDPSVAPVAEDGDVLEEEETKTVQTPVKPRKSRTSTPKEKKKKEMQVEADRGPEFEASQMWATEYQTSEAYKKKPATLRPANAALRAYALWQHHNFDVPFLATLLSIQAPTVAAYIAWTLQLEELTYDKQRMNTVLGYIPEQLQSKRYWKIRQACRKSY